MSSTNDLKAPGGRCTSWPQDAVIISLTAPPIHTLSIPLNPVCHFVYKSLLLAKGLKDRAPGALPRALSVFAAIGYKVNVNVVTIVGVASAISTLSDAAGWPQ